MVHWLKPRPACANCGQTLERAEEGEGHYLGAAFFPIAKLLWLAIDLYIQPEY
jgi:uncharacterized protein (DUF983 family)